jgi:hypothetical protein
MLSGESANIAAPLQLRFFASGSMLGKTELKLLRPVDGSGGKHE